MPLTVGSRLGHYDVTALIGEGGMGQVYQATDTRLDRTVAIGPRRSCPGNGTLYSWGTPRSVSPVAESQLMTPWGPSGAGSSGGFLGTGRA